VPTEPARNGGADEQPCTNPAEGRPAASHGSLVDGHVGRYAARAAVTAHHALGLRDVSRTDLISFAGQAFFLEVSVVPGMTETSALPMALAAAGRSLGPVCRDLLGQAAARGT